MSQWAHDMAQKTYLDIQKKKKRQLEGIKQANKYMYENMCYNRGIRQHYRNNNKVVVPKR